MVSRFLGFLIGAVLLLNASDAAAQHVQTNVLREDASGLTLAFEIDWQTPLQEAVDSLGATSLSPQLAAAASGGRLHASKSFEMPSLGLPNATLVEAAFDEVQLPEAATDAILVEELEGSVLEVGWPGISARRALATASVRLLGYDPEEQTLRRYRRVVVDIRHPLSAGKGGAFLRAGGQNNPHLAVERSVLADGYLFKIPVRTEGVYRIGGDYLNQALNRVGLALSEVDPASIKVYGNGGEPLPALNAAPRPADLIENPVVVQGAGDNLEVVFYARAPRGWRFDAEERAWKHYTHPFSNDNYYFLKVGAGAPDDAVRREARRVEDERVRRRPVGAHEVLGGGRFDATHARSEPPKQPRLSERYEAVWIEQSLTQEYASGLREGELHLPVVVGK